MWRRRSPGYFADDVVSTDTVPMAIYSPCWSQKVRTDRLSELIQATASPVETAGREDQKCCFFGQFGPWERVFGPVRVDLQ
jgi:hypothetical protein